MVKLAICFLFYILGAYATTDMLRLLKGSEVSVNAPDCYCPKCKKRIALCDQLPLISYIKNRGRCRSCKSLIPLGNFLLEGYLFAALSGICIRLDFSWSAYLLCILLYEGTKLILLMRYGRRKQAFVRNLLWSLWNNLFLFGLLAVLFLLKQIM